MGAGPAGLALAEALRETGRSIVVLESGGAGADGVVQEPLTSAGAGIAAEQFGKSHARGVGGTATIWNTMMSGEAWAKYAPLDEADFASREWVASSGWPISLDNLRPWYQRAYVMCSAGSGPVETPEPARAGALRLGCYRLGPASRFTTEIPSSIRVSTNVMLVHGASATGFQRSQGGRITDVSWVSGNGVRGSVNAEHFILAMGGIENARFLLDDRSAATDARPASEWLGRGFMEHPIDRSVQVFSRRPALGLGKHFLGAHSIDGSGPVIGRIAFDPVLLQEERLPNMSLRFGGADEPLGVPPAPLRPAIHRVIPSRRVRRMLGASVRGAVAWRHRLTGAEHRLLIDLEQWPHRDNRVVLTGARGRHGQALAELQWQWRGDEEALRLRAQLVVQRELERQGFGRARLVPDLPVDPFAHHHAGTTRMHDDAQEGVVDADLRVFGEENLYVTGSSVFPTAGVANPTLTIVALSLRLAEYLEKIV
ncbi:MAG: GMC oxidoreductase [Gemmatimonadaceae bacterium]